MKITALRTGRFAHPVVSEPQIEVVEGTEYVVDTQIGGALIDCGWAEEFNEDNDKHIEPVPVAKKTPKTRKKKSKKDK